MSLFDSSHAPLLPRWTSSTSVILHLGHAMWDRSVKPLLSPAIINKLESRREASVTPEIGLRAISRTIRQLFSERERARGVTLTLWDIYKSLARAKTLSLSLSLCSTVITSERLFSVQSEWRESLLVKRWRFMARISWPCSFWSINCAEKNYVTDNWMFAPVSTRAGESMCEYDNRI